MAHLPYEYHSPEPNVYVFESDANHVYTVTFTYPDRFFLESCSNCKDILEVDIRCQTCELPPNDFRVGVTIFNIFNEILSDSCNGIIYRCVDKDGKECKRKMKFDRWYDDFNDEEKIERFAQEFCDENNVCVEYYILVDKGCLNAQQMQDDFQYRCRACAGEEEDDCMI